MIREYSAWSSVTIQEADDLEPVSKPDFPVELKNTTCWDNDPGNKNLKVENTEENLDLLNGRPGWTQA